MLAGQNNDAYTPTDIFGGEADIVTGSETIASGNKIAERTVLGRVTATGKLVPLDPDATDGSEKAVAISVTAIDASTADAQGPVYKGGYFNPNALVWPEDITDAQKAAAFDGTPIHLRVPGYSG